MPLCRSPVGSVGLESPPLAGHDCYAAMVVVHRDPNRATTLIDAPLVAVGDGVHMLGLNGRDLVLEDIRGETETRMLAENCSIGRIGEPGWGL